MKATVRLCFSYIFLLAFVLSQALGEEDTERSFCWGEENGGFKLSLSFEERTPAHMSPIYAVLVLSNATDRVLQTIRTSIQDSYKIVVTDESGSSIPLTRYGQEKINKSHSATVQPMGIQPGKTFTDKILLNRLYDLTMDGAYSVQISRIIANPDIKGWMYVTSNVVQVNVPY